MANTLAVYLRNHEAAAHGGLALFRRAARSQRHRPWGHQIGAVGADVRTDLNTLHQLMRRRQVRTDRLQEVALQFGELIARAKPNGRLIRRSPLSDLIEVEAMLDAVHAKQCGWEALLAAGGVVATETSTLSDLRLRAEDQQRRLLQIHQEVAAHVFTSA